MAGFTGQDMRAFLAFVALLELYACADEPSQPLVLDAMRKTLRCMQEYQRPMARWAIPAVLDWPDMDRLWPTLAGGERPGPAEVAR